MCRSRNRLLPEGGPLTSDRSAGEKATTLRRAISSVTESRGLLLQNAVRPPEVKTQPSSSVPFSETTVPKTEHSFSPHFKSSLEELVLNDREPERR